MICLLIYKEDLWDKKIFEDPEDRVQNEGMELIMLNIKVGEALDFYHWLGGDNELIYNIKNTNTSKFEDRKQSKKIKY